MRLHGAGGVCGCDCQATGKLGSWRKSSPGLSRLSDLSHGSRIPGFSVGSFLCEAHVSVWRVALSMAVAGFWRFLAAGALLGAGGKLNPPTPGASVKTICHRGRRF